MSQGPSGLEPPHEETARIAAGITITAVIMEMNSVFFIGQYCCGFRKDIFLHQSTNLRKTAN
jgi:hypothetical protein